MLLMVCMSVSWCEWLAGAQILVCVFPEAAAIVVPVINMPGSQADLLVGGLLATSDGVKDRGAQS